jgi:mannitol/fructose-specific phosphotransferase system IIA component (Ntr-type)
MRLTDFLSEPVIRVPLQGTNKEEILRELVDVVCAQRDDLEADPIFESVIERERLMSTGIGQGIALPHGLSPSPLTLAAALGIPSEPVDFEAIDGQPVTLIFFLVSDEANLNSKMRALARISRLLHRKEFRSVLAASTSPAEAMQVIVDEEARRWI